MIYKLKLIFSYPLALPQASRLMRLEFAAFHALLGIGFLLGPYQAIGIGVLASILLVLRSLKSSPYIAEHIMFGWQRISLMGSGACIFLMLFESGNINTMAWLIGSKVGIALCAYDSYLAFNGVTGLFFINMKKFKK